MSFTKFNRPGLLSLLAMAALLLSSTRIASAGVVVSLVGDKDGFGLPSAPAVPTEGTLWRTDLGGSYWTDYRDAADLAGAPFTDIWAANIAVNYLHTYDLAGATPSGALLSVQFAGVADDRGPWDVFFNGTLLGQIPTFRGPGEEELIRTLSWNVPVGLLTGSDTVLLNINTPEYTDGYSINFSELTIKTAGESAPDAGATIALLGLGLVAVAGVRRLLVAR